MRVEQIGSSTLYLGDCMELVKQYPDKYFDLAIVDPPYGIKVFKNRYKSRLAKCRNYKPFFGGDKKPPDSAYFIELLRVSKHQIIWGANHFIDRIPYRSSCWIFWDKQTGNFSSADGELAWTNYKTAVRKFVFRWAGMLQGDMKYKEIRIHPTQKPVALYKWLLSNYAKQGNKILDTHLGSGSIAIACNELGFELTAIEIDEDYFNTACKRIKETIKHYEKT